MADRFRLTIAQVNPTVGAFAANAGLALEAWQAGRAAGADLVACPEMVITGYQAQDLVMRPAFTEAAMAEVARLAERAADGPALGVGAPLAEGGRLYNAYHILQGGRIAATFRKHELPNFNVFDEIRIFDSGPISGPVRIGAARIGVPICEDAWHEDVPETMAETGAEFLVVPNGSPYFRGKFDIRMGQMVARTVETGLPLAYVNLVGGQDDQMFDGGSFVLNPGGRLAMLMPVFETGIAHVDFERGAEGWRAVDGDKAVHPGTLEQDYRVMVAALADYLRKTGFTRVLLGLSGGIDSALVATIAADAVGPANVRGVMLPSEYTSQASLDDAAGVAEALGIRLDTVPIEGARDAVGAALAPLFAGTTPDIAEENIQSRLRGLMLMALSNKFGEMLLTTGNKSEVAVGYATIYGDMAGGYNPIKDVYKMRVFAAAAWRNHNHRDWMKGPAGQVIPDRILTKPPTAELRANQRDDDSLPPYEELDAILELLVDGDASVAEIVAEGYDRETVKKVERLVYLSEYKRFQSAPGPRISRKAFWLDRRYPIVNRWRDEG